MRLARELTRQSPSEVLHVLLLDYPGRFMYRHHVNTYMAMRAFCSDYHYIVYWTVALVATLTAWLLARPDTLRYLGITE